MQKPTPGRIPVILALIYGFLFMSPSLAAEYQLAIQPILSKSKTEQAYKPLADYLSRATGHKITVKASMNFLGYWESMRRGNGYDIVLDAAHFTDYRDRKMKYTVVAKLQDTVTFSLVTNEDVLLFEPEELIAKKVATIPSPSLGGVRLAELFPNPLRQPRIVGTPNAQEALKKLKNGEVDAALVPTPLIRGDTSLNVVVTTEPVPHMAFSTSSKIDPKTRNAIRKALTSAQKTPEGQAMLKAINLPGFDPASNANYNGYASLLDGVWGY
jgi:ABC-type phosphate/phosphonate transport system substrate-binding protein